MLLAWVVFPLVLALLCAGWGLLSRDLVRIPLDGALVVPFGLAALIAATGLLTAWPAIAPANVTVCAVGAAVGLGQHAWRARRRALALDPWAVLLALALLFVFGAPVILSGQPTFAGYLKLDDTATWLSLADQVTSHGRSLAGLSPSTYQLNLHYYLYGAGYPIGSFLALGVARGLTGIDAAWVLQPYLSFCGAAIGLAVYSAARGLVAPAWLRTLVAFLAAQAALLYGYAQWGGIKELTAAAVLVLFGVLAGRVARGRQPEPGLLLGVAIAGAALADTLGPGAVAWLAPAVLFVAGVIAWRERAAAGVIGVARTTAAVLWRPALLLAALLLPVWLELSSFISGATPLFSSTGGASSGAGESGLVSLYHPLSVLQLGGVWPVGDFRVTASAAVTAPFLAAVALGLVMAVLARTPRRHPEVLVYAGIALLACVIVWLGGSNPWVVAKALAIAAPAVPAVALLGAASLWPRVPLLAIVVVEAIGVGVVWSNVRAYHNVTLAPYTRLAELQRIAPLVADHGPTLINEYEPYADRHFLRDGAPTEPAEYRSAPIALDDGALLTRSAWADLDSFNVQTLLAYPSLVTRVSPVASRPSSAYSLIWRGRYYELWREPPGAAARILEHVPLGDSSRYPYCGRSLAGSEPLCSVMPVAGAPCPLVHQLARVAAADHAGLVAYQRPAPIVARADQSRWPGPWLHYPSSETLVPTIPGTVRFRIALDSTQVYSLWLGGSFGRGFQVSVDGRPVGSVQNELANIGQYSEVGRLRLTSGVHEIDLRYPPAGPGPGAGAQDTSLSALVLQPLASPVSRLIRVAPQQAGVLCGRGLDWIEVVKG